MNVRGLAGDVPGDKRQFVTGAAWFQGLEPRSQGAFAVKAATCQFIRRTTTGQAVTAIAALFRTAGMVWHRVSSGCFRGKNP